MRRLASTRGRRRAALAALFALATAFGLAACGSDRSPSAATTREIHLPRGADPEHLTSAEDGSLWVTEAGGEAVARVRPDGRVRQYSLPGSENGASDIAEGPDGEIWVTGSEEILRIDPGSGAVAVDAGFGPSANPNIGFPVALSAGPDAAVWYTSSENPPRIRRITEGGQLSSFNLPGSAEYSMTGIALGSDGALWFTQSSTTPGAPADGIGRLTVDGKFRRWPLPQARAEPSRIVSGPGGDLWFTAESAHRIDRITTAGQISEFTLRPGIDPVAITSDPDGTVWFTSSHKVGSISPNGSVSEWRIPNAKLLSDVAPGPDGGVWLADNEADVIRYFRPGS